MGNIGKKPKRSRRERLVALLAAFLALLMLLPMVFMIVSNLVGAGAASVGDIQSQINGLKSRNQELAGKKSSLQGELRTLQANKGEAISRKNVLEQQIGVLQEEIDNLDAQLVQYGLLIEEKKQEVADNEAREAAQFDLFCRQVRAMEKEGTASYLSILFSADSFPDLLDKMHTVNSIADYNDQICEQLQTARAALQRSKAELETAQTETQETKTAREETQAELSQQEGQVEAVIAELAADESQTQAAIHQLDLDAAAMDAEIAAKERELQDAIEAARRAEEERKRREEEERRRQEALAAQQAKPTTPAGNTYQFDPGSGYVWPLPANRVNVTSFFGYRKDPFTGKTANHGGTDIGAPSGTSIYAAHGGVVLISAYSNSYGNYVVLSRGDGLTTLYAHMSKRAVEAGGTVSQGQVIGYVGSTGRSTAPHLHLEFRQNGTRQDALAYYPNLNWVNHTGYDYR